MADSFHDSPLVITFAVSIGVWVGAAFSLLIDPALPLIVGLASAIVIWVADMAAGDDT